MHAVKAFTELDGKTFMVRNCARSQGVHGAGWEDVHGKELCVQYGKTFMVRNCARSQGVRGAGWEDVHGKELCTQSRRSRSWMGRRSW